MAYDRDLAERIRDLLDSEPDLTEREMFGGLAFLIAGNMAVGASGQGGLMVRVDKSESDALVAGTKARLMEMGERTMKGWLLVDSAGIVTDAALTEWVERGVGFARTIPAK